MQHYQTQQRANTYTTLPDGTRRYSRYEVGVIDGRYRAMPVLIADKAGFDGLGFDASVGSGDDHYTVLNLFDGSHKYIDSVAVVGADDDDHAAHLALSQFDYLGADYATVVVNDSAQFDDMSLDALGQRGWSSQAIAQLMNHPSQNTGYYLPIINSKMLRTEQNRVTADNVMWDGANLVSHGSDYSRLLLDLQKHDAFGGLTAKFDMRELLADLGATELGFDALMETYSRLDAMGDRLFTALGHHAIGDLTVTNVTTTKPFKRQGVANVAMQFDLSDGQTFSIIFHNPDADPKKLAAGDTMVSWKWLLNKKDVTAAVSPKQSDKVRYDVIASRIMKVAAKNSKRFVAAQMKKAENQEKITEAQKAVDDKQAYLEQLDKDIAELKQQIDDFRLSDEAAAVSADKAKASSRQKITVQPLSAVGRSAADDLIDKAMEVAAKDIDKIVQDIRTANKKIQNAESMAEKTDIMEQKNRLDQKLKNARLKLFDIEDAITAFYRNGTSLDDVDLLELFPKVAALIGVGQSINEAAAVGGAPADSVSDAKAINQADDFQQPPIEITGKELGEFDTDTEAGMQALRKVVFQKIQNLAKANSSVYCRNLKQRVYFSVTGAKKYQRFSGDARKLQAAAKISAIIADGKRFKSSENSYLTQLGTNQEQSMIYHYLATPLLIDGKPCFARVVIREDHNNTFYWDLRIKNDFKNLFDSMKKTIDLPHTMVGDNGLVKDDNQNSSLNQPLFDKANTNDRQQADLLHYDVLTGKYVKKHLETGN